MEDIIFSSIELGLLFFIALSVGSMSKDLYEILKIFKELNKRNDL